MRGAPGFVRLKKWELHEAATELLRGTRCRKVPSALNFKSTRTNFRVVRLVKQRRDRRHYQ
jgi:hypothetical protein